jgi:hypothetical protein
MEDTQNSGQPSIPNNDNDNESNVASQQGLNNLFEAPLISTLKVEQLAALSKNLYALLAHGGSATEKGLLPIQLKENEKIIMNCIDGCVLYNYIWENLFDTVIQPTSFYNKDVVFREKLFSNLLSNSHYNKSLCIFDHSSPVPNIFLDPRPNTKDIVKRWGLFKLPIIVVPKIKTHKTHKTPKVRKSSIYNLKKKNSNHFINIVSYNKYQDYEESDIPLTLDKIVEDVRENTKGKGFTLVVFSCRYSAKFNAEPKLIKFKIPGNHREFVSPKSIMNHLKTTTFKLRTTKNQVEQIKKLKTILEKNSISNTKDLKNILLFFKKYLLDNKLISANNISKKDIFKPLFESKIKEFLEINQWRLNIIIYFSHLDLDILSRLYENFLILCIKHIIKKETYKDYQFVFITIYDFLKQYLYKLFNLSNENYMTSALNNLLNFIKYFDIKFFENLTENLTEKDKIILKIKSLITKFIIYKIIEKCIYGQGDDTSIIIGHINDKSQGEKYISIITDFYEKEGISDDKFLWVFTYANKFASNILDIREYFRDYMKIPSNVDAVNRLGLTFQSNLISDTSLDSSIEFPDNGYELYCNRLEPIFVAD